MEEKIEIEIETTAFKTKNAKKLKKEMESLVERLEDKTKESGQLILDSAPFSFSEEPHDAYIARGFIKDDIFIGIAFLDSFFAILRKNLEQGDNVIVNMKHNEEKYAIRIRKDSVMADKPIFSFEEIGAFLESKWALENYMEHYNFAIQESEKNKEV